MQGEDILGAYASNFLVSRKDNLAAPHVYLLGRSWSDIWTPRWHFQTSCGYHGSWSYCVCYGPGEAPPAPIFQEEVKMVLSSGWMRSLERPLTEKGEQREEEEKGKIESGLENGEEGSLEGEIFEEK